MDFPNASELESHHQIQFTVIPRTLTGGGEYFHSAIGVFYTPTDRDFAKNAVCSIDLYVLHKLSFIFIFCYLFSISWSILI